VTYDNNDAMQPRATIMTIIMSPVTTVLFTVLDFSASLSINTASLSANGVDLSSISSVGLRVCLSVCPESVLWHNG